MSQTICVKLMLLFFCYHQNVTEHNITQVMRVFVNLCDALQQRVGERNVQGISKYLYLNYYILVAC